VQCAADHSPVLMVGYDTPTVGALTSVTDSRGLLAVAMVIAPERSERSVASLDWSVAGSEGDAAPADTPPHSQAAQSLAGINPMAQALGLFESLAHLDDGAGAPVSLQLSATLSLRLQLRPLSRG